jgi:hypothetical protein
MNQDNRHYQAKSIRERLLFKQYLKSDNSFCYKFTPFDGTDQHDVTYYTLHYGLKSSLVEIKVRNINYQDINGGYYIEKPKYDYLMSKANQYDEVLYINIFPDGILIWDLKQCPVPNFDNQNLPKNNHSNSKKEKEAGYLYFWDRKELITTDIDIHKTLQKSYEILKRIGR